MLYNSRAQRYRSNRQPVVGGLRSGGKHAWGGTAGEIWRRGSRRVFLGSRQLVQRLKEGQMDLKIIPKAWDTVAVVRTEFRGPCQEDQTSGSA